MKRYESVVKQERREKHEKARKTRKAWKAWKTRKTYNSANFPSFSPSNILKFSSFFFVISVSIRSTEPTRSISLFWRNSINSLSIIALKFLFYSASLIPNNDFSWKHTLEKQLKLHILAFNKTIFLFIFYF